MYDLGFALERELERLRTQSDRYDKLLSAVQQKFTGETRHETALRYIKEAESFESQGHDVEELYPE